jgi:tetratricopeptide (TPR) repeat protein
VSQRNKGPNHRLAAWMREAGISNKGLAKRMQDASRQDGGEHVSPSHTSIAKYLNGQIARPSDRSCQVMAKVLSHLLGRPLTLDDIGYPAAAPEAADTTLEYPATIGDSITAITQLTAHELRSDAGMAKLFVVPEAWAALLVKAMYGQDGEGVTPAEPVQLSPSHVQEVRDATEMFSTFDHRYGGGQSKLLVAQYLQTSVLPLIPRVSPESQTGREYFQAVAALTLRAGWTAYDVGDHAVAQRFLYQAYRLARAAGDRPFAGHVLACMSHQANFLGHFEHAVHLARAASQGSAGQATPTSMSLFHSMEARALASQGNERDAVAALNNAESWLGRSNPEDDPDWVWFFDHAELHAEFAHCFRDLGNSEKAHEHAQASIDASKDVFVRSLSFCHSVLATSHLLANDLDEAVRVAMGVIDTASSLKSYRVISYLNDFRQQLKGCSQSTALVCFEDYFSEKLTSESSPFAGGILMP